MWHVSVSVWSRRNTITTNPNLAEKEAIRLLTGVGGDTEWWIDLNNIGHLRVAVTAAEHDRIPSGCAVDDAGDSGPARPRTH